MLLSQPLQVLAKDPDGFWLMVEGGDIDWSAHDNNLDNLIGTVLDFDKAVANVVNWIDNNGGWEENLFIVTADHDHYLTLNPNYPQLLSTLGPEAMTDALVTGVAGHFWGSDAAIKYGWGSHSNRPVPVYYQGVGSEVLNNAVGMGYNAYGNSVFGLPGLIDQVHIYQAQRKALEAVPEPSTILGLLTFTVSIFTISRKRNIA